MRFLDVNHTIGRRTPSRAHDLTNLVLDADGEEALDLEA